MTVHRYRIEIRQGNGKAPTFSDIAYYLEEIAKHVRGKQEIPIRIRDEQSANYCAIEMYDDGD